MLRLLNDYIDSEVGRSVIGPALVDWFNFERDSVYDTCVITFEVALVRAYAFVYTHE